MLRTALYTTLYPSALQYLRPWYESVRAQSEHRFDLCISLDGISVYEAEQAVGRGIPARWITSGSCESPSSIRNKALTWLEHEYDYVILADADDVLDESRLESAVQALEVHDVVGCALRLIDKDGRDLGRVFKPSQSVTLDEILPRHNIFGLSNTAYRSGVLKSCLPIPRDCVVSDWLLATRAWCSGARFHFDFSPRMYYRQHDTNTAGVLLPFSEARVLNATNLVLKHYSFVLSTPAPLPADKRKEIEVASVRAQQFSDSVKTSAQLLTEYVTALNGLEPTYVWWWCVAHSELERIWKN
jgi:glycosyltransferase involved in cell wall biosynthesis